MSATGVSFGPTQVPENPAAPVPGSEAAEIAILATCIAIFFLYHLWYFERHIVLRHMWLGKAKKTLAMDLWTTAIETRVMWAREMIKQPKKDDNLLAMHTMRYVVGL